MENQDNEMDYLFSSQWWSTSIKFAMANSNRLILPAFLLAVSNICSEVSNSFLNGGIDLGTLSNNPNDLDKLIRLAINLLLLGLLGLVTGLTSLSIWIMELTAIARVKFSEQGSSVADCMKELRAANKHLGIVWLIGFAYLLVPALPMSALIALSVLVNMDLKAFDQPLVAVPHEYILPMNIAAGILFLVVLDFTLLLAIISANTKISPKQANSLASDFLLKSIPQMFGMNCFLVLLNVGISAPFMIASLFPQMAVLSKNLNYNIACQIWFAFSSICTWTLSLLVFVEFLKDKIPKIESPVEIQNH